MPYADHFALADDLIAHLDAVLVLLCHFPSDLN